MDLIDISLYLTYTLAAVGVLILLYFSVLQILKNPKNSIGSLLGVAGIIVVLVVAYFLSSGTDISAALLEKTGATESSIKYVGAGLITVYVMLAVVVVTLVYAELSKMLKK
jgi:hypothetical protein